MRTLLIGLLVGGLAGFALTKYVFEDDAGARRRDRTDAGDTEYDSSQPVTESSDRDALLARIRDLEAKLAAYGEGKEEEDLFGGIEVPITEEGIVNLLEEWERDMSRLDRLLALIKSLLLQGEKGYPRLTRVLMRFVGFAGSGNISEEEGLQKIVPALKVAMSHEKELVGYVGYLLSTDNVPGMLKTGAMGAAMFLSINRVRGSEEFGPVLLKAFMEGGSGGPFGGGRDQERMLIEAMGFLKQPEAVDPLLAMLKDPAKENMHRRAVEALGRIGDPRAVGVLVARLQADTDERSWWRNSGEITALARIGTQESLAAAETYLSNLSSDDKFFGMASSYLRARPSEKVVGMIRDRFRNNPNSQNMWNAVYGLRNAGTPTAIATLEEIARDAGQEGVRRTAQRFLDERKKLAEQQAALSDG